MAGKNVADSKVVIALLAKAGVSQRYGAECIGINERTMRKYIAGDLPAPKTVIMALELLGSTRNVNFTEAKKPARRSRSA